MIYRLNQLPNRRQLPLHQLINKILKRPWFKVGIQIFPIQIPKILGKLWCIITTHKLAISVLILETHHITHEILWISDELRFECCYCCFQFFRRNLVGIWVRIMLSYYVKIGDRALTKFFGITSPLFSSNS